MKQKKFNIYTPYVVQMKIYGLSDYPLSLRKKDIRENFRPIFTSRKCFKDMHTLIWDDLKPQKPVNLPNTPFIQDLGFVGFNARSLLTKSENRVNRQKMPYLLTDCDEYWDPNSTKKNTKVIADPRAFGFDPARDDQRMNNLYFELRRPLFLKACFDNQTVADGKIFIHLFPSGYVTLLLAVSFKNNQIKDLESLKYLLLETRPDCSRCRWHWKSRIKEGDLSELFDFVIEKVFKSIFNEPSHSKSISPSFSAYRFVTEDDALDIAIYLGQDPNEYFQIHKESWGEPTPEALLIGTRNLLCTLSPYRHPNSQRSLFWRFVMLYETARLRYQIYKDYIDFLERETTDLKTKRYNISKRMKDLFTISKYKNSVPDYLLALRNHVKKATPFQRGAYYSMLDGIGLPSCFKKLQGTVKEWESEVTL